MSEEQKTAIELSQEVQYLEVNEESVFKSLSNLREEFPTLSGLEPRNQEVWEKDCELRELIEMVGEDQIFLRYPEDCGYEDGTIISFDLLQVTGMGLPAALIMAVWMANHNPTSVILSQAIDVSRTIYTLDAWWD